jgi:hypothetical protein
MSTKILNYNQSVDGFTASALRDKGGAAYNALAYSVTGDGSTDDSSALNTLITTVNSAGGGVIIIPGGKTYAIAATVVLKSDVQIKLSAGAIIKWTGAAGGTMFGTGGVDPLMRSGVFGRSAKIDPNALADFIFDLSSPEFCDFGHYEILSGRASTVVYRIQANSSNATGYESHNNAVFNNFRSIVVNGTCSKVYVLSGSSVSSVVTLNHFEDVEARDVRTTGIDLVQWCDNNYFDGYIRIELQANNAVGVLFNSGSAGSDVGVYGNVFVHVAVDTFTGGGLTGRVGVKLNNSKDNQILAYHNNPTAEGGSVVDSGSSSHLIVQIGLSSSTTVYHFTKGTSFQTGGTLDSGQSAITCTSTTTDATPIILSPRLITGTNGLALWNGQGTFQMSANISGTLYGNLFLPTLDRHSDLSSHTVNEVRNYYSRVDGTVNYTANVQVVFHYYADNCSMPSNALGTQAAFYSQPLTKATNNWGVYISANNSLFNGLNIFGAAQTPLYSVHAWGSGLRLQAVAAPATPTLTKTGASTTATYAYAVVSKDLAGNTSLASTTSATQTNAATLDGSNFNTVTWVAVPGAASYDVYRITATSATGNSAQTGKLSVGTSVVGTSFQDQGGTASGTVPLRNNTADVTIDGFATLHNGLFAAANCLAEGVMYTSTANVSVATAVTATLIGSGVGTLTLPANFLIAGRTIRIRAKGYVTTTAAPSTLIFLSKLGATTVSNTNNGTGVAPTASMTAKPWDMEQDITCRTVGSSGTVMAVGLVRMSTSATVTFNTANLAAILMCSTATPATVTVNTTTSLAIDFQVTDAGTGTTVVCTNFTVEVLN